MPFRCKISQSLETMSCALTERMFRWWRVDGKKSFAQITQTPSPGTPLPQGKTVHGWNSARPTGIKYFLAHAFDIDTQLDWLLARRPAYLATFSGIVKELAVTTQRRGIDLKFKLVFSCAAHVDTQAREPGGTFEMIDRSHRRDCKRAESCCLRKNGADIFGDNAPVVRLGKIFRGVRLQGGCKVACCAARERENDYR